MHDIVLVFVHGMWGSGKLFDAWRQRCDSKGVRSYAIELPHSSRVGQQPSFDDYVAYVKGRLDSLAPLQSVVLVGHSMGGLIAQKVAADMPDVVKGLVLVASAPPAGIRHVAGFWLKPRYLAAALAGLPFCISKKDAQRHVMNAMGTEDQEALYASFRPESGRALAAIAWGVPVTRRIFCPVLVVSGRYDRLLPCSVQARLARKLDALHRVVPTGHMVQVEDMGRALEGILEWVARAVQKRWTVPV